MSVPVPLVRPVANVSGNYVNSVPPPPPTHPKKKKKEEEEEEDKERKKTENGIRINIFM